MATNRTTPSISTPRTLDLRAIQQAIDNIRERLRAIDTQLGITGKQAAQTAQTVGQGNSLNAYVLQQLAALQAQLDDLTAAPAPAPAPAPAAGREVLYDETGRALFDHLGVTLYDSAD